MVSPEATNSPFYNRGLINSVLATDALFHQPEHPRVKVLRLSERLRLYDPEFGGLPPPPTAPNFEKSQSKPASPQRQRSRPWPVTSRVSFTPKMPLFPTVPASGFQALILCGPGVSLNTFTSNPEEYPKALVTVGNRPIVWYVLDWCYRMGVSNITLITPPASAGPIQAALDQNPHLTSLPSPSANILAPQSLTFTTGTAELLRLPEIQACIRSDFLLLPCDLICGLPGESLLEAWMITQGGLGGATGGDEIEFLGPKMVGSGGEKGGRRGALGVWYQTKGREESVKGEETDFVATAPLDDGEEPVVPPPDRESVLARLSKLVYAMPMDSLKDEMEEKEGFQVRYSLLHQHPRVKMLTTFRDAHIYLFPYWVKDFAARNQGFESISEDLVGTWAKAGWRKSAFGEKLGLREIFEENPDSRTILGEDEDDEIENEIDLAAMSTTRSSRKKQNGHVSQQLSTRVDSQPPVHIPPILAYTHSTAPSAPFIRRVDNTPLLLSVSLRLAKLESIEDVGRAAASSFAHNAKVTHPGGLAAKTTVTKADCLLAENVTVEEKCVIKECVIGANCQISTGSRLTRCVLMDGVVVGEKCQLTGCVIGKKSKIGREAVLKDCEVQDGNFVPDATDAKNEKFMIGGLEDDLDGDFEEDGEGIDFGAA